MADAFVEALGALTQEELSILSEQQQNVLNICLGHLQSFNNILQSNTTLLNSFNTSIANQLKNTQVNSQKMRSVKSTQLYSDLMDMRMDTLAMQLAQEGYKTLTLVGEKLRELTTETPQTIKYSIFYSSSESGATLKSNTVNLNDYLNLWSNINQNGLITLKTDLKDFQNVSQDIQLRWNDIKQILKMTREQIAQDIINTDANKIDGLLNNDKYKFSEEQKKVNKTF